MLPPKYLSYPLQYTFNTLPWGGPGRTRGLPARDVSGGFPSKKYISRHPLPPSLCPSPRLSLTPFSFFQCSQSLLTLYLSSIQKRFEFTKGALCPVMMLMHAVARQNNVRGGWKWYPKDAPYTHYSCYL